jgi:hypothetical protein
MFVEFYDGRVCEGGFFCFCRVEGRKGGECGESEFRDNVSSGVNPLYGISGEYSVSSFRSLLSF